MEHDLLRQAPTRPRRALRHFLSRRTLCLTVTAVGIICVGCRDDIMDPGRRHLTPSRPLKLLDPGLDSLESPAFVTQILTITGADAVSANLGVRWHYNTIYEASISGSVTATSHYGLTTLRWLARNLYSMKTLLACLAVLGSLTGPVAAGAQSAPTREELGHIVTSAWSTRKQRINDRAHVDARSLYLLFGRDPGYRRFVPALDSALAIEGDTADTGPMSEREAYQHPRWRLRRVELAPDGSATLVARTTLGSTEHTETYWLARSLGVWSVSEIRLSAFTYY